MKNFTKNVSLFILSEISDSIYIQSLEKNFKNVVISDDIKSVSSLVSKSYIDILLVDLEKNLDQKLDLITFLKKENPLFLILCISLDLQPETLVKVIDLGIDGYLQKPFDAALFLSKIEMLESKYKMFEEYQTNQKNLNLLLQYQNITDQSSIISKTDKLGVITYANENFCDITGYTQEELVGKNHNIIRHPETKSEIFYEMWDTIKNKKQHWNGVLKNKAKDGSSYYVKTTITPIIDKSGNIVEYIALRQDMSPIVSDKQLFLDTVDSNLLSLLILVQINGFDMLERFYNHTTINSIEKMFGFKLIDYFPDEFIFKNIFHLENGRYALVANLDDFMEYEIFLKTYLSQFENNVKTIPLEIDGIEYDINVSISYSMGKHMLYEDAKAGLEEALEKNIALFNANDYSIKQQIEAKKNLDVIKMVKTALENYKVVSYFQPIINNKTMQVEKYESLVRLVDEDGNIVSPYEFLNISKKGAYYNRITLRVLDNSFEMLHTINTKLSINLSALDIEKEDTKQYIYNLLDEYSEDAHRVVFELLEDENVKDFNSIKEFIKTVKSLGVSIAIDDFGAGYSNFERLLAFDPDIIKIDGSLIKNILTNEYNKSVVETIVSFAKKQDIGVIAEFVETKEIFEYLNSIGVDYSQGYYFGKPIQSIS